MRNQEERDVPVIFQRKNLVSIDWFMNRDRKEKEEDGFPRTNGISKILNASAEFTTAGANERSKKAWNTSKRKYNGHLSVADFKSKE